MKEHKDQEERERAADGEPWGRSLLTLPRRGSVEVRLSWDVAQNPPYARFLSLRKWKSGRPTREGVSIRIGEIAAFADAIVQAIRLAAEERPEEVDRLTAAQARIQKAREMASRAFSELTS